MHFGSPNFETGLWLASASVHGPRTVKEALLRPALRLQVKPGERKGPCNERGVAGVLWRRCCEIAQSITRSQPKLLMRVRIARPVRKRWTMRDPTQDDCEGSCGPAYQRKVPQLGDWACFLLPRDTWDARCAARTPVVSWFRQDVNDWPKLRHPKLCYPMPWAQPALLRKLDATLRPLRSKMYITLMSLQQFFTAGMAVDDFIKLCELHSLYVTCLDFSLGNVCKNEKS